jgi:hypothetical protein
MHRDCPLFARGMERVRAGKIGDRIGVPVNPLTPLRPVEEFPSSFIGATPPVAVGRPAS